MKELWNKEQEARFFSQAKEFANSEQLFYVADDGSHYAYWPKSYKGTKTTLQSRNAFIGNYTEKWTADLLKDFIQSRGYYVVQGAKCNEIGLIERSPADLAVCQTKSIYQKPEDIILIIEVKMSIVWNWQLITKDGDEKLICIGNYKTHQGNPGLLRSDTMLKAIGKSINIRVSSTKSSRIPILILGNTPITNNYYDKVDHLKLSGVIQGFWSVNPNPLAESGATQGLWSVKHDILDDIEGNIKSTNRLGFYRFDTHEELLIRLNELLQEEGEFFSGMRTRKELGEIIEIADRETSYEKKAQRFLELLKE